MRKLTLPVVILAVLLAGCKTPGCLIQNEASMIASNFVSTTLQCTKTQNMADDINTFFSDHLGLCSHGSEDKMIQGPIAQVICPQISAAVVHFIQDAGDSFLEKYGCSANSASAVVQEQLTAFCERLPLSPIKGD